MQLNVAPRLPPLRQDLDLVPGPPRLDGSPTWSLHDPARNLFFRIGWLEFELLKRWPLGDPGKVVREVRARTSLKATPEQLEKLLAFLTGNQLIRAEGKEGFERLEKAKKEAVGADKGIVTRLLKTLMFFRIPLVRPDAFLTRSLPLVRFFFSPGMARLLFPLALLGLFLVMRQWDLFTSTFLYFFSPEGFVYFILATLFSKAVHELGHAYAAKRQGLQVPTMGVAFMMMFPVFYTDTSEAWKLTDPKARFSISSAGILAELMLAVAATLLWSFLPEGPAKSAVFYVAAVSWITTLAVNLSPFMRFDGYYLLADWLDVANLQSRGFAQGKWRMREFLFGLGEPNPEPALSPRLRRIMTLYAYGTWIYRGLLFLGLALLVYHLFFKLAGILLFLVEMVWFLAAPMAKELNEWWERRAMMRWNRQTFFSTLSLLALLGVLVFPWSTDIHAPALLKSAAHTVIFPPERARLKAVHVAWGQAVNRGDKLFTLDSPDLAFERDQARLAVKALKAERAALTGRLRRLEQRHVIEERLLETQTRLAGIEDRIAKLTVTAPFAGRVVETADALSPGRWLSEEIPLARLIDPQQLVVEAFVKESELGRLDPAGKTPFYPDNLDVEPFPVVVKGIDPAHTPTLDEPYLASIFDGPIAVRPGEGGSLVSHETIYRVTLMAATKRPVPAQALPGTALLDAVPESLLERAATLAAAVFIRESGF